MVRIRKKLKRKRINKILNMDNPYMFQVLDVNKDDELNDIQLKIAG